MFRSAPNFETFVVNRRKHSELEPFERYFKRAFRVSSLLMFVSIGLVGEIINMMIKKPATLSATDFEQSVATRTFDGPLKIHPERLHGYFVDERQGFSVALSRESVLGIGPFVPPRPQQVFAPPPDTGPLVVINFIGALFFAGAAVVITFSGRRSNELRALYNRFETLARNLTGMQDNLKFEMNAVLKALRKKFRAFQKHEALFQDLIASRNANTHFGWFWSTFAISTPTHLLKEMTLALEELANPLLLEVTPFVQINVVKETTHIFSVVRRKMAENLPYVFYRNVAGEFCVFSYADYAAFAGDRMKDGGVLDLTEVTMKDVVESETMKSRQGANAVVFVPMEFSWLQVGTLIKKYKKNGWPLDLLVITSNGTSRSEVLGIFPVNRVYLDLPKI